MHEELLDVLSGLFRELLRKIVGRSFSNQSFTATGRPVEKKSLWRLMLKFCKQICMQERQFDRILDCAQRIFLTPDLFPGQFGNGFQIIFFGFRMA